MKSINLYIFIFIVGLFFYSCNKDKEVKVLTSEVFLFDSELHTPYFLSVTDKSLIISNTQGDTIINVYDIQTSTKTNQFLLRGEGPNELLHLMGIQYSSVDSCIYLSDPFRKLMYKVEKYEDTNPVIKKIFQYASVDNEPNIIGDWCRYMSNGKIICAGITPAGMLTYLNPNFTMIKHFEKFPDKSLVNENLSDIANIMLYQSCSSVSPNGNHLAVAYYGADIIGVASTVNKDSVSVHFNKKAYPNDIYVAQYSSQSSQAAYTGKSMSYYVGITSSDKYFYVLYKGKRNRDCEQGLSRAAHVKCFDWDLNLISEFNLDQDALQIAVSPDDQYIYALTSSSDNGYRILKYGL